MEPNNERISSKVFAAVIATGLMSFSGVLVETSMNIAFPTLLRDFECFNQCCAMDDFNLFACSFNYRANLCCIKKFI